MFTHKIIALGVALAVLASTSLVFADDSTPTAKNKTFDGTVSAINEKEGIVSVKGLVFTRDFHASDDCKVSLEQKPDASWMQLQPGQKVEVAYQNAHGVLVAHEIHQRDLTSKGYITAIDPGSRAVVIKSGLFSRQFAIGKDCTVNMSDKKVSLDQLKIGHAVNVTYEPRNGLLIAREIDQPNATFVGTIQAIDTRLGTVKAERLTDNKQFTLADDCKIVVAGRLDGKLDDLRVGDRVDFTYENNGGVLVANRLGLERATSKEQTAQNRIPEYQIP